MRLQYDKTPMDSRQPLVLTGVGGQRIEIHIKKNHSDSFTLISFAGDSGCSPNKERLLGGYQHRDQAVAAARAIVASLPAGVFRRSADEPRWSLEAQRIIRQMRLEQADNTGNYRFDPKDVYPDL